MKRPLFFLALAAAALPHLARADKPLDPLLSGTGLWQTPREGFVWNHRDLGFKWLDEAKGRAETNARDVTLFGGKICEMDVNFPGTTLGGYDISIYNRGDAGELDLPAWQKLVGNTIAALDKLTSVQPEVQGHEAASAVNAYGMTWHTPTRTFLLEYSFTKESKVKGIPFRAEFLRLRVLPPEQKQTFMAAALASTAPQSAVFNGPAHLKKTPSGDVYVQGVPMVDQGNKGYCLDASVERVMRYFGIPVDEHEIAELANSSAEGGTSTEAMYDVLKSRAQRLRIHTRIVLDMQGSHFADFIRPYNQIAHRKHVNEIPEAVTRYPSLALLTGLDSSAFVEARNRNKADTAHFQQIIQDSVDQGIPLLWSVIYGIVPEPKGPGGVGGHMRLIIGYNSTTNEILYSDSWGSGHELKRMPATNGWAMTTSIYCIEPIGPDNS